MKLKFTKMHGAGNDFIVIDAINQEIAFGPKQWKWLADRHFGIGADQILVVEKPSAEQIGEVDFRYRIYNADGGEVEQCGNGSRAFVKFVVEQGLTQKRCIRVATMKGIIEPCLTDDGNVCVNMGAPRFGDIPFEPKGATPQTEGTAQLWPLQLAHGQVWISAVSMGNPHAVQVVVDVDTAPVSASGPEIEHHAWFPARVNAGFMQVLDRHHIALRVFERGVGETLACGTGACAAAVVGIQRGLLDSPVSVAMRGGTLSIAWAGGEQPVMMTGPAVSVFEAEIEVPC